MPEATSRPPAARAGWLAYGAVVVAVSALYYGLLSRLRGSDEGGLRWFARRLSPALPTADPGRPAIWIHAVSAGESKIAELLRSRLAASAPEIAVVLSATTYSGHARVRRAAGERASFVMPFDTLAGQRRVVRAVRPDLMVLIESEFWPAHFAALDEAEVPVIVVNGNMSGPSFRRHARWPGVAQATLQRAERIYVQSEAMRERFLALGVDHDRLWVCGNLKLAAPAVAVPRRASERPMVTFGNVHAAELPAVAASVAALRAARPDLRLVLVPRYPGATDIGRVRGAFGAELIPIERLDQLDAAGSLVWINAMGLLAELYARSDIGVVCGTFAPIGGHDLAEPLQQGAASLYGPHVERQMPLHVVLQQSGVAQQVSSAADLPAAVLGLLDQPEARTVALARFREIAAAADRMVVEVAEALAAEAHAHRARSAPAAQR